MLGNALGGDPASGEHSVAEVPDRLAIILPVALRVFGCSNAAGQSAVSYRTGQLFPFGYRLSPFSRAARSGKESALSRSRMPIYAATCSPQHLLNHARRIAYAHHATCSEVLWLHGRYSRQCSLSEDHRYQCTARCSRPYYCRRRLSCTLLTRVSDHPQAAA